MKSLKDDGFQPCIHLQEVVGRYRWNIGDNISHTAEAGLPSSTIKQSINQSTNQSVKEQASQQVNQSISPSINHSIYRISIYHL